MRLEYSKTLTTLQGAFTVHTMYTDTKLPSICEPKERLDECAGRLHTCPIRGPLKQRASAMLVDRHTASTELELQEVRMKLVLGSE